jgi:hypothetical protein
VVIWGRLDKPINLGIVQEIESLLKQKFPKEYVDDVLLFNGGHPKPDRFDSVKRKGYVMHRLLTLLNDPIGLINIISYIRDGIPDGIIPFGYEITGDLIYFDFKHHPETPSIVLWKHELAPDEGECRKSRGNEKDWLRIYQ